MKDLMDFNATTSNNIGEVVAGADTQIRDILSGCTSNFSQGGFLGIGATDFIGINEAGLEKLQAAVAKYCDNTYSQVDQFNENANIDNAFKGDVALAVKAFVQGTKDLIKNYVSNVKQESKEATELFEAYKRGTADIQANVDTGVEQIRDNAQKVKFD